MDDQGTSSSINMSNSLPPPASPNSSSPSSSYRTFSHLPFELVQQIIESTVPHHYRSSTYTTRQATLRSLCLVCRLFRRIANPLLEAVVLIDRETAMDIWLSTRNAVREIRLPTELVIGFLSLDYGVQPLLVRGTSLKVLTIYDIDVEVDLASLILLQNLTILRFSDLSLENTQSVILPTIEDLKLLRIFTGSLAPLLSRTTFPALRALCYYVEGRDEYDSDPNVSALLAGLAPGLQVLSLDASVRPELSVETAQMVNAFTLYDLDVDADDVPKVQNIRLINIEEDSDVAGMLKFLAAAVSERNPLTHQLIYLPESPSIIWSSIETQSELNRLEEICKEKRVEIVREEEPESWISDSCISADFWRRIKEAS